MQTRSIIDIIKGADQAEDLDRLYIHTAAINLVNAAVAKLGGRQHWIASDTQKAVAIMNILEDIHPLKREYTPPVRENGAKKEPAVSEFAPKGGSMTTVLPTKEPLFAKGGAMALKDMERGTPVVPSPQSSSAAIDLLKAIDVSPADADDIEKGISELLGRKA
jgi:hypothetical protein